MATIIGNNGKVKINGATVACVTSFSLEQTANAIEDSCLGQTHVEYKVGKTNWTASIECNWDNADSSGQGSILTGTQVTLELQPEGDSPGEPEYSGNAVVTGVSLSQADESIVTASFSLQGNGVLTKGTVS